MSLPEVKKYDIIKKAISKVFLPKFNAKFMVKPRSKANLHKKLNEQEKKKLDSIFSRQHQRVVRNDFTIGHKKNHYQLEKVQPITICKQDIVIAEERMDKSAHFKLRGKYLNYRLLPERPKKINSGKNNLQWVIPGTTAHTPPANHPWRQILFPIQRYDLSIFRYNSIFSLS